jgi:Right handed beta helix region
LAIRRILFLLAVLAAALWSAQAAPAKPVRCGAKITADTVLRSNLSGCQGTAIAIGADGVTLDLDGHTVEGAIVASGRSEVAIRDGVVFGEVRLEDVRRASVLRLRVRHGSIECLRSAGCTIVGNAVTGDGIAIERGEVGVPNRVRRNLVSRASGPGIAVDRTDTTQVTRNVVRDSAIGIEASHAADLLIARNLLVHNRGAGLSGSFGSTAMITGNLIAANAGDGISLRTWGGETRVAHNVVVRNRGNGILGLVVAHWRVTANLAARNGASGIAIAGAVEDATLAQNHVRRNGGLGIAAAGVLDGGANRALLNGVAAQCLGVVCS